jgi:hypothetical protein
LLLCFLNRHHHNLNNINNNIIMDKSLPRALLALLSALQQIICINIIITINRIHLRQIFPLHQLYLSHQYNSIIPHHLNSHSIMPQY